MTTQCNEVCKIARALNSTAISKYVTLKMTDEPSKHVWKIKESCYFYTTINCIQLSYRQREQLYVFNLFWKHLFIFLVYRFVGED